jgi:hypothetical protein
MNKNTYGTYWMHDKLKDLLSRYLKREITSEQFSEDFFKLRAMGQTMEFSNIHDAWKQGYLDSKDETRLIKESKLHDYLENYKHNYE